MRSMRTCRARMLTAVVILSMAIVLRAEQIPCKTGQNYCTGQQSLSVINGSYFCCESGFNMQWKNEVDNGTAMASCLCNRHFFESDCIEGLNECRDAPNLMSDGVTTKCCKNGDSMNSVSNSFVNGVKVDYCKCIRYLINGAQGIVNTGGVFRPMTDDERSQLMATMNQLSRELQSTFDHLSRAISQNLRMFGLDFGLNRGIHRSMGGFSNWAANFLDGLAGSFRQGFAQDGTKSPGNDTLSTDENTQTTPVSKFRPWDSQSRRFQQLQRRLQRLQQNRNNMGFFDRLTGSSLFEQMANQGSWLPRSWRQLFGKGDNGNKNTTPVESVASNNNTQNKNSSDDVSSTNPYNTAPAHNLSITTVP